MGKSDLGAEEVEIRLPGDEPYAPDEFKRPKKCSQGEATEVPLLL